MNSTIENRKSKISYLPLKLGIGVVLLFAAVIATCLLWTPVKIRYYAAKLTSDNPKERVAGIDGLLGMGEKSFGALTRNILSGDKEAEFLLKYWRYRNTIVPDDPMKRTALHLAVEKGYAATVRFMLDGGADSNVRMSPDYDRMKTSYQPPDIYRTPLHVAAMFNRTEIAKILIAHGAEIEALDVKNITPLHQAATKGNLEIARFLINRGARGKVHRRTGATLLCSAAQGGNIELIDLLIKRGADVNVKDAIGCTPLHWAADFGHLDAAVLLIEKGADVNAKSTNGWVPLHCAAMHDYKNVAALLIEKDTDVNARTDKGETPLDDAIRCKSKETVGLLRAHGAKTGEELKASSVEGQGSSVEEKKR